MLGSVVFTKLHIATGYWDLPVTELICKELDAFFARGIGKATRARRAKSNMLEAKEKR